MLLAGAKLDVVSGKVGWAAAVTARAPGRRGGAGHFHPRWPSSSGHVTTVDALGDTSITDFLLVGSRSSSRYGNGRTLSLEDPGSYPRIFKLSE